MLHILHNCHPLLFKLSTVSIEFRSTNYVNTLILDAIGSFYMLYTEFLQCGAHCKNSYTDYTENPYTLLVH
jgi:hypothetical protein